eukprot:TRINITY_DN3138_c0_g1_i1.p1 TRINITY_DN3138_c0_g1~~TRINITY_DN3138_c0_g1_i1.p1  ORF type:complete len:439 (+),score=114.88 TRINITY_DN3138_c0_g1_i1:20-1336(+)
MNYYLFIYFTLLTVFLHTSNAYEVANNRKPFVCDRVNLLYTWVDGSDPVHQLARAKRLNQKMDSASANRFRDMDGLLYSLRSVEVNAPWIDKIFIYTASQVPKFLNVSHPKIRMLFHDDVFPNKYDLPTFSSNAIEASFPFLPDEVGPCFVYLNDDMFFGDRVTPANFYGEQGQYLYEDGWEAPAPLDVQEWDEWHKSIATSNSYLDAAKIRMLFHDDVFPNKYDLPTFSSNAIEASFPFLPDEVGPCFVYLNDDMFFGDRVTPANFYGEQGQYLYEDGWEAPAPLDVQEWDEWHKSIATSNSYLDAVFGEARRKYTAHGPYFFSLPILREMGEVFAVEFNRTMTHPTREVTDTAFPFLYHHYTYYNYQSVCGGSILKWQGLFNDPDRVCAELANIALEKPKVVCLNDQMGDESSDTVVQCSINLMNSLFPKKSSFEL